MLKPNDRRQSFVLGVIFAMAATPAFAQGIAQGQYAFDNLLPTVERSPGGMVAAGVARAAGRITPLRFTEIVETEEMVSPWEQFRLDAIDVLVDEINTVFVFLVRQIFARAGVPVDENAASLAPGLDLSQFLPADSKAVQPPPVKSRQIR